MYSRIHIVLCTYYCVTCQEGYGEFDGWLSGCVERAAEPLRVDGDPSEILKQLKEQQVCIVLFYIHTYYMCTLYCILCMYCIL